MASETHDAAGQAASTPGLPQLDFSTFGNQIFWLLVTLVVIYFVLSRIALPRIAAVLAERKGAITNDLAAAEDLKAKAVEAEQAYLKALADARAEAQTIVGQAKADAEIAARAAEGEQKIADIRASAMDSVKEVAVAAAAEIVAVMGGKADVKTVGAAVADRMKG